MTPATPAPRSRRERPAKPALSHAGIVGAAVRIMRAEGLQRVTMRRLATELDTGPASLYVYFGNTAELHAAILEEYLGAVDLSPAKAPAAPQDDWRERLVQVLASYTGVLFEHPSLARSALVARPTGANYLALVEAVLGLLDEGGVPPGQAAWGVDVLLQLATAAAAEQATRSETDSAEEEHDALVGALRGASADAYPHIAAVGDELFSGNPQQRLGWMFRVVVNGALTTPR